MCIVYRMTVKHLDKPVDSARLRELVKLEHQIHYCQLGESDFEYRDYLEKIRLKVVTAYYEEVARLEQEREQARAEASSVRA